MGQAIQPLAIVDVSIGKDNLALTTSLSLRKLAFIFGAIGPDLSALTIPHFIHPFACVHRLIVQGDSRAGFSNIVCRSLHFGATVEEIHGFYIR